MERLVLRNDWYLRKDDDNAGREQGFPAGFSPEGCVRANLPARIAEFFPGCASPVWFYRRFPWAEALDAGTELRLCFDKVDYQCEVWLNGIRLGEHRHAEEPFSYDITGAIRAGDNLLACRVYSPCSVNEGLEGITLRNIPNKGRASYSYIFDNSGGIYGDVALEKRPRIAVGDIHVIPDFDTGEVTARLSMVNHLDGEAAATIGYSILERHSVLLTGSVGTTLEPGDSARELRCAVPDAKKWSPDAPNLYTLLVTVRSACGEQTRSVRFGFKRFCVKDGFFCLNGKRVFLKCAHSNDLTPRMVAQAKAMGFQALRYLTRMPDPEVLDYCDEAGLMIYEECAVSWGMSDYPEMPGHMEAYLDNMIRRDRNHACVAIWGIFNETPCENKALGAERLPGKHLLEVAVAHLPRMRELDPTRLILLSSGRWDARLDIGSVSNPGSGVWEHQWGKERPGPVEFARCPDDPALSPYVEGMGDNHLYPTVPLSPSTVRFIRSIGSGGKPVFISEYGVGCQPDLQREWADALRLGVSPDSAMVRESEKEYRALEAFIQRYGLGDVYPSAEDFSLASMRKNARQRMLSIDPLRANPRICGYSLTSYSVGHEGVFSSEDGEYIPGIVDALNDSFAPLRWAVFPEAECLRAGESFTVEIVLCNEDVLPPGNYGMQLAIQGPRGVVARREISFDYPNGDPLPPLAAPVCKETFDGLEAGTYAVTLKLSGAPTLQPACGVREFRVIAPRADWSGKTVGLCGGTKGLEPWLNRYNAAVVDFESLDSGLILVGALPEDGEGPDRCRRLLAEKAKRGCTVVMLDGSFWAKEEASLPFCQDRPAGQASPGFVGRWTGFRNWLYHVDNYVPAGSVFDGLVDCGIVDMELFGEVYPSHYLLDAQRPDVTHCAAFGGGLCWGEGTISALTLGEYNVGKGRIVVNAFNILENIGSSVVADQLLIRLIDRFLG